MTDRDKEADIPQAALDLALDQAPERPWPVPEQASLPLASEEGNLLPPKPEPPKRGRGRPEGARNKRTQEVADYLLSRYRSPLEVLAETYSLPVEVLAQKLGCTRYEAKKLQLAAADKLAPYLHQKQPVAIDPGDGGLVSLVIQAAGPAGGSAPAEGGVVLDMMPVEIKENQGVSEGETSELDKGELDN